LDRGLLAGLCLLFFLLLGSGTAQADSATPTNYKSTVFDVDPATDAARFDIVGGDAFIGITVEPGHTAQVPGYFKEPYIRIDADGAVWVNLDSPAYYINQDRYGNVQAPPEADGKGEPRWEGAGSNGRYVWQDHRVHWMSFDLPPTVAGDRYQVVFPWEVPVVIDGQEASVRGELVWVPSRNPWWPLLAGMVGLLPLIFWDRLTVVQSIVILGLAASLALLIALLQLGSTPAGARSLPLSILLLLVAVGAVVAAAVFWKRSPRRAQGLVGAGGLAVVIWAVLNAGMLWLPVLPSAVVANLQRAGVATVMWAGVAVAGIMGLQLVRTR
jgi:hypothetical protein